MIEADPGNIHLFKEVEDFWNFIHIEPVDGESESDLDTGGLAVSNAFHGIAKRTLCTPETVVYLFHPVQADTHIGQTDRFEGFCRRFGNQGAVGRDDRPHPLFHGVSGKLGEVFSNQRFSTGKQEHRYTEVG